MSRPIINYTTEIAVSRTLGELQGVLSEAGARNISIDYGEDRQPTGIAFAIRTAAGLLDYRLPVNIEGVLAKLDELSNEYVTSRPKYGYSTQRRRLPQSRVTREHAARVGWRVLKDWAEAQLTLIEIGLVKLDEVMLPYQLVDGDKTLYQVAVEKGLLALPRPAKAGA